MLLFIVKILCVFQVLRSLDFLEHYSSVIRNYQINGFVISFPGVHVDPSSI